MKKIIVWNGSLTGNNGNTQLLLNEFKKYFEPNLFQLEIINLNADKFDLQEKLKSADGFVFTTGTYWDSWGSPLQKLIEDLTDYEAKAEILFKPCAVIVTMHAFGGKEILSRLQGVLNTMGLLIPPMTGFVYGLAIQVALSRSEEFARDFWSLDDLEFIAHNLKTAVLKEHHYKAWPVDRLDPKRRWLTCET